MVGASAEWFDSSLPRHVLSQGVVMKRASNPVIEQDVGKQLLFRCMVCDKPVEGFYARFGTSGTCGRVCMKAQDSKEKFPGHTEEDFFNRR